MAVRQLDASKYGTVFWMPLECAQLRRDIRGLPHVIIVQECDEITRGSCHTAIACCGSANTSRTEIGDGIRRRNVRRVVCGIIVHHNWL